MLTSRAHQLFRQIIDADDPAQVLKDMIASTSKRTETEFLEFKGAGKNPPKKVKESWSQTLSAFANTEGGVLIWGIRAARIEHPDDPSREIDVASELDLVPAPPTFVQTLKDVLLEACIEPVQGIEIQDIDAGEGDGSGFVVCLIPEGKHKPYRAELDPRRQYYQRVGDNSVVIPHSLLRSLFYPRISPNLSVTIAATVLSDSETSKIRFVGEIANTGNATAKDVCVVVETPLDVKLLRNGGHITKARNERKGGTISRLFRFQEDVHPGQTLGVFTCMWENERAHRGDDGRCIPTGDADFGIEVFALDQEAQSLVAHFDQGELTKDVVKTCSLK